MDEPTIACSLGEEDYRKRLSSIRKVGEAAFLEVEPRPDGAVLSFRDSEQVRAELASIVEAEAACCSFLELSVHTQEDRLIPDHPFSARGDAGRARPHGELPRRALTEGLSRGRGDQATC